ncbi:NOA1, partial [Symbiodinium sp. KB8]
VKNTFIEVSEEMQLEDVGYGRPNDALLAVRSNADHRTEVPLCLCAAVARRAARDSSQLEDLSGHVNKLTAEDNAVLQFNPDGFSGDTVGCVSKASSVSNRTAIKTYVFPSQTPSNLETEIQAAGASSSAKEASEHEPSSNQMGLPYELPHSLSPDAAVEQQEAAECCRINPCPTNATTNSHDPGQHALGFAVVITLLSHVLSSAALRTRKGVPYAGHPDGPTGEELEAMVDELVPDSRRSNPGIFDPHTDNPLTKGIAMKPRISTNNATFLSSIDLMTRASKASEHPALENSDVDRYVRFSNYLQKWSQRDSRNKINLRGCRCLASVGAFFSDRYIVDVLDFNGSFIRKIRQIVGKNPVILVGTKIDSRLVLEVCEFEGVQDLLPPKTKLELVEKWLLYILRKKKLRVVNAAWRTVKLVSNETGKHINHAVNAIIEARSGMDVFVVGAANAGKSRFITRLLDRLEASSWWAWESASQQ